MIAHRIPLQADGTIDRQAFFDEAARLVITQGDACMMEAACVYFGPGDTHCAVGFFLDENPKINGDVYALFNHGEFNSHDLGFLSAVQDAHDEASTSTDFVSDFKRRMSNVADAYGLN